MARENKFKKNLNKDKVKEIVGTSSIEVEVEGDVDLIEQTKPIKSIEDNNQAEVETKSTKTEKNKSSKKTVPTKKLKEDGDIKKPKFSKLGVPIKETVKYKVDALAEDNNMRANEVVIDLLKRVFDGKNFTIEIEQKDKTKITSFNIPVEMEKAIIKINKQTGTPKSEIFNRLLEESLKDFFE